MRARIALLLLFCVVGAATALEPKDVFVIYNRDVPESKIVAEHYLTRRNVPAANLIPLALPTGEDITRADYDAKIASPVREFLQDKKKACRVLLTVYGVPLRVGPKVPTDREKVEITALSKEQAALKAQEAELTKANDKPQELVVVRARLAAIEPKLLTRTGDQSVASVDSELMLLWWPDYDPTRWIISPLFWALPEADRKKAPPMILTSRLDGPSAQIAMQLVDDAIATEKAGLKGKAYFDARGLKLDIDNKEQYTGYEGYDEGFREAAALMKKAGFDTVLDDREPVFAAGSCKDVALYAGWYSHGTFVDSCEFTRGAVAWHLASSEAVTLRDKASKVWCPNLLKRGVCATLGPVAEPYSVAFPKASEFFGFLATGELTLVECYARTTILGGWQMVLVGDPLYNPFAKRAALKVSDVKASPWGQK